MKDFGIIPPKYSNVIRANLTNRIQTIKKNHSNCGEKVVSGQLRSLDLQVQGEKVREVIREVDPEGVEDRRRRAPKSREYNVPCPPYLWHVDGNPKLIRYRIVQQHVKGNRQQACRESCSSAVEGMFLGATIQKIEGCNFNFFFNASKSTIRGANRTKKDALP